MQQRGGGAKTPQKLSGKKPLTKLSSSEIRRIENSTNLIKSVRLISAAERMTMQDKECKDETKLAKMKLSDLEIYED